MKEEQGFKKGDCIRFLRDDSGFSTGNVYACLGHGTFLNDDYKPVVLAGTGTGVYERIINREGVENKMKEKIKIKKGDWFRVLRDNLSFTKDNIYQAVDNCTLIDNKGDRVLIVGSATGFLQKLYTIQDLKDGKVAVVNNGKVEELNKIVNHCFYVKVKGNARYYFENNEDTGWDASNSTDMPTQSVKDFLAQLPEEESVEESDMDFRMPSFPVCGTIKGSFTPIKDESNTNSFDTINPKHYAFNIKGARCDVFDIANAMGLDIEQATALRYFRKKKDPIEDTKKAIKCLERYLDRLEDGKRGKFTEMEKSNDV